MGKTYRRNGSDRDEDLFIRSKRRAEPDLRKLARALLAIAQAEVEAEADHESGRANVAAAASRANDRFAKQRDDASNAVPDGSQT
jgi:hypothetical protein